MFTCKYGLLIFPRWTTLHSQINKILDASAPCTSPLLVSAGLKSKQEKTLQSQGHQDWRRNPTHECCSSDPELDLSVPKVQRHSWDFCHQNVVSYMPVVFWEGKMLRDVQPYGEFLWMYFKEITHAVSQQTSNPKQPGALQNCPLNFVETKAGVPSSFWDHWI